MVKYNDNQIDQIFQSLADSTRRDILNRVSKEKLDVTQIASKYEMSLPAVSKHLRVLESAELIEYKKKGREKIYTANPRTLLEIQKYIDYYTKYWNDRFDNLENYLKHKKQK